MTTKFRFVCGTRHSIDTFPTQTALGMSLRTYAPYGFIELRLFPQNSLGLPSIYNAALREAADDPAVLIFVHDDVHITDYFWPKHLMDGLGAFDIVGVAGNRRRVPNQPAWCFLDDKMTRDTPQNISGIVGHGRGFPPQDLSFFGPPGQPVVLLDGLLLAARSETLLKRQVAFDERFDFHFYDMDFCREAERQGLRMGTCMVSVIHESTGNYSSANWRSSYEKYLDKWKS